MEKSNAAEVERESTQFEVIAQRLDLFRNRVRNVTESICQVTDNLNGSEPPSPTTAKEPGLKDSPGDSILSGLHRLLQELEAAVEDLEAEHQRLYKIFF